MIYYLLQHLLSQLWMLRVCLWYHGSDQDRRLSHDHCWWHQHRTGEDFLQQEQKNTMVCFQSQPVCWRFCNVLFSTLLPGMWFPSYLMSISWRPRSVGEYFTVTVPSLLSVMCGQVVRPDGIRTSPDMSQTGNIFYHHGVHVEAYIKQSQIRNTILIHDFWQNSQNTLTCNFTWLYSEGNNQTKRAEHRLHPIYRGDGFISGLNKKEKRQKKRNHTELWKSARKMRHRRKHRRAAERLRGLNLRDTEREKSVESEIWGMLNSCYWSDKINMRGHHEGKNSELRRVEYTTQNTT